MTFPGGVFRVCGSLLTAVLWTDLRDDGKR